jgi:GT2 family glycosyltransferase
MSASALPPPALVRGAAPWEDGRLEASVTIVTRDRLPEVLGCVRSVLAQQGCSIEVIVIDDGSTDGSAEGLSRRFDDVAVYRSQTPAGPAGQRNFAASVARGEFIFGIDDDAELIDPRTIADTIADFTAGPDIGAVAIPYLEREAGGAVTRFHHARSEEVEIVEQFVAAAYAVRREAFLTVGGYSGHLFYYGEERDLCVRLLQAGYLVRLGTAAPLEHRPCQLRQDELRAFHGRRNDALFAWQNVPARALPRHVAMTTMNGAIAAGRIAGGAYAKHMLRGMIQGWRDARLYRRHPVDLGTYRLSLQLRRRGPLSLPAAREQRMRHAAQRPAG